jgi:hypothetical protein
MTESQGTDLPAVEEAEEEEVNIEVKTLDLEGKGFYPQYRKIIVFKEAFTDPANATLAVVQEAIDFLCEYIVKPETLEEKMALIEDMDADDFMNLFGSIGGRSKAVPPTKSVD